MKKNLGLIVFLLVMLQSYTPFAAQPFTPVLEIHVFDVGQGDSTLIIGPRPDRKTLLIDAGEELQGGSRTHYKEIAQKIRTLTGKNSIDYVVLSHYHFDHMGTQMAQSGDGLWGLIEEEKIRIGILVDRGDNVPFGDPTGPLKKYRDRIQTWVQQKRVTRRETAVLGRDQIGLGGGVVVEIVAANGNGVLQRVNTARPGYFARCPPSENDYSIALKISVGIFEYFTGGDLAGFDHTRLFPGNVCQSYNDVETTIASRVGNVEVMKLNHHGSEHSSNPLFMRMLSPEFIIVTSGSGNGYNHPSRKAMTRATAFAEVLITGGVSPAEWPNGLLRGMTVIHGDVDIYIDAGGKQYKLQDKLFRSFSLAEESRGDDRRYFQQQIRNKGLISSQSIRDTH